jgi:hypothetical protein
MVAVHSIPDLLLFYKIVVLQILTWTLLSLFLVFSI